MSLVIEQQQGDENLIVRSIFYWQKLNLMVEPINSKHDPNKKHIYTARSYGMMLKVFFFNIHEAFPPTTNWQHSSRFVNKSWPRPTVSLRRDSAVFSTNSFSCQSLLTEAKVILQTSIFSPMLSESELIVEWKQVFGNRWHTSRCLHRSIISPVGWEIKFGWCRMFVIMTQIEGLFGRKRSR